MKDLITLTITYDDNKREAMVLSKNSEAHRAMLSYAEANGYATEQESANEIDHSKNHYLCDFRCADIVEIHTKESLEANYRGSNLYDITQGANEKEWSYKGEQITFSELMEKLERAPNPYSEESGSYPSEVDHNYYMSDCGGMLIKRIW
jgi:hypothetical protein|tara:strand:+ start:2693 stop:3139 length:447 start_codon:yes stop_codon:yes gene_type:complete